ncbi:MAG: DNA cytosine methyltransferase [Cyclobacteriaceae bacterium]
MLSVTEASIKLSLTPQQVRNLCRDSKLKSEKIGSTWIINEKSVEELISSSHCGVAEDQAIYGFTARDRNRPVVLSFFSGAMGMDLGLERAGFQTLFASEIDKACRKTILKNKPDIALVGDIREYSAREVRFISGVDDDEEIDLVVGGPPCQAFSTAGKRKAFEDERGNVFLTFIDMILDLNPRFAVIENVRGLLSAPLKHRPHNERGKEFEELSIEELPGGALNHIINRLENAGYSVNFNLYNAANFGTPQKRERVILICSRDTGKLPYLKPTHSEKEEYGLPKWRTFRDAVKDLDSNEHDHLNFPEKRLKYYRLLKAGQNWKNLNEDLQKEAMGASYYSGGGKTGFLRKLDWNKPSPTLVTHPAMPATDLCHPSENRPLSVQEYMKIQQFPHEWEIQGSMLDKYKQIGNAVPVGLGYAVGRLLMQVIRGEEIERVQGFNYSRYKRTSETEWRREFETLIHRHNQELVTAK